MSGEQIKLFLVDGAPGGPTTAEITNWTGHVLSARRSDLAELLKRDEAQRTGVYLLLGDDVEAIGETRCYIGEADVVAERLRHHHRDKDSSDRLVVITSQDTNLTKSHCRYPESKLITLATQANRVTLSNGTASPEPAVPEADASCHGLLPRAAPDRAARARRQRHPNRASVVPIGPRELAAAMAGANGSTTRAHSASGRAEVWSDSHEDQTV